MRIRCLFPFFILAAFLIGCAKQTPIPEFQSPEAKIYQLRCSGCHSTPHPARVDLGIFRIKVITKEGPMPVFSEGEKKAVMSFISYLKGQTSASAGEKIYNLRCRVCHTLDPEQLKQSDPKINVISGIVMPVTSEKEKETILAYLRKFAKRVK